MPGIFGYIKESPQETQISNMFKSFDSETTSIKDEIFCNDFVESGHIHLGHMKTCTKIKFQDGIYISIEGEQYDFQNITFEELLFNSYRNKTLEIMLNQLDGYFNALIYDSNINKVFLISDRYGMRMLYYYFRNGRFAWSGEVKSLLSLDFVDKTISQKSFDCFIDLGHLLEDNTWFEYIKLIKPATIIEYDIHSKSLSEKYYWKWSDIKQQNISFEEAVNILGNLFINSVKKRFNLNKKVGLSLSGGLDSRAIFAAINHLYPEFKGYCYTFGMDGCDDIEIAKLVASKTNWEHKIFCFTENNWFQSRIDKVWFTDGMLNMMHMHGAEFLDEIKNNIDFSMNGFLGDVVCGLSYINSKEHFYNKRITIDIANEYYQGYMQKESIYNDFFNILHIEPFLAMNRGRRFINMGTVSGLKKIDQRKPFFDNELIEFIYSISDEYRKNNKLYSAMLLKFFPDFFVDIPWQKTRKNIDGSENNLLKNQNIIREYINYASAIRDKKVLNSLYRILNYDNSIYKNFTNIDVIQKYLQPHLNNIQINHIEKIFRYATIELYLKKVFEIND